MNLEKVLHFKQECIVEFSAYGEAKGLLAMWRWVQTRPEIPPPLHFPELCHSQHLSALFIGSPVSRIGCSSFPPFLRGGCHIQLLDHSHCPGSTWLGLACCDVGRAGHWRPPADFVTCFSSLLPIECIEEEGPSSSRVRSKTGSRGSEKGRSSQGQGGHRQGWAESFSLLLTLILILRSGWLRWSVSAGLLLSRIPNKFWG